MQQYQPQRPVSSTQEQQVAAQQQVKFYKSGIFLFGSAPGRFQRDVERMAAQGWRVREIAYLGTNIWLQRIISVVYERDAPRS